VFLCILDSLARLYVFFCFLLFCCFVGLMDMSSMEEDQVSHDVTQVIGNSGASPSIMGLHDVLRNIEQMLAPFKYYIEASEAGVAQVPSMVQAPPMAQALLMAQAPQALLLLKPLMQGSLSLSCQRSLMGLDQSFVVLCNKSISSCGFILLVTLKTPRKWLS
jgi:hypothetical protein